MALRESGGGDKDSGAATGGGMSKRRRDGYAKARKLLKANKYNARKTGLVRWSEFKDLQDDIKEVCVDPIEVKSFACMDIVQLIPFTISNLAKSITRAPNRAVYGLSGELEQSYLDFHRVYC